jgi:hypothetical protein
VNLLLATSAAFVAYGFWLFSKSFLNAYYEAQEWDSYAMSSLAFTALAVSAAFLFAVTAAKYALLFVL